MKFGISFTNTKYLLLCLGLALFCLFPSVRADTYRHFDNKWKAEMGIPVYAWYRTGEKPKAIIVAVHGATLHGRSFDRMGMDLAKQGYLTLATDIRGFGDWYHRWENEESKRILYHQSDEDVKKLLALLRQEFPGQPIFLAGESLGANMAIKILADDNTLADGLILSSPAVKQRYFINSSVIATFVRVVFKPSTQLSVVPYIKARVSEDPKICEERVNDPLGRTRMNVGEIFKTRYYNKECERLVGQIPSEKAVLVIEGAKDKLFVADDAKNLLARFKAEDKRLEMLSERGHIHLETDYLDPKVLTLLSSWLEEKTALVASRKEKEFKL